MQLARVLFKTRICQRSFFTAAKLSSTGSARNLDSSFGAKFALTKMQLGKMNMYAMRNFSTQPEEAKAPNTGQKQAVPEEEMEKLKQQVSRISQCMALGQYAEAQKLLNVYKTNLEKYFTADHPAYLSYENNQGVLWRMNGHFEDAYDMLFSVYNKYKKMLGGNHPSTISACVNVATVLRDLHDYEQSIKFYEEAKEMRKETMDENHPDYAVVLGMSAGAYRSIQPETEENLQKAYSYLKEAYVIMANHYKGEECLPCAVILNSMGLLFKQQRKFERAIDAYERALAVRVKLLGEGHPDCLATRHNLGELYTTWGKPEQAKEYLEENIRIMNEKQEEERKRKQQEKDGHSHDGHQHGPDCNH